MSKYFDLVYEDSDLMVINKPSGLVVESEKKEDTTLETILNKEYSIKLPRSGIVHRLDRDTSGLMVVAKSEKALVGLQNQFASRTVKKIYQALVYGKLEPMKGTIELPLKRDPKNRTRFVASRAQDAKEAITKYEVAKYIDRQGPISLLNVNILTGRTHQIRAHMLAIGFPIIGDQVYKSVQSQELSKKIGLSRQFLHAGELLFKHPISGKVMSFKAELPGDLEKVIK